MKIIHVILAVVMLLTQQALSNNVEVSNVRLTGQDTTNNFTMVEFDITWENSWRYNGGPNNWDAAWIFVKYRIAAGQWMHAWLNNTGHVSCAATTIENGLLNPGDAYNITTNPALGVFLYRSSAGSGTFSCQDVKLRWNYGTNNVVDADMVDVRVFAIEMVYVPQGSFKVGDGQLIGGTLYQYNPPGTEQPYLINSENEILVGQVNGQLYYNNPGFSGDGLGPIPSTYPKGYKAFYLMKYEITQQGYVDFLNTLNREQQGSRVRSDISGNQVSNRFVMVNSTSPLGGNGIWTYPYIPIQPGPVLFSCNYNNNGIPEELGDGHSVACGSLLWKDMAAYLDWTALRPMTELEYEKAGRGPLTPVIGEYSWGNSFIRRNPTIFNPGFPNSTTDTLVNVNCFPSGIAYRVGIFARAGTDRTFAGAGYYGAMELTGNLYEKVITLGNPAGRSYTGTHGNGLLDVVGNANVTSWPDPTSANGIGNRGGSIDSPDSDLSLKLSNRVFAAYNQGDPYGKGGRGVRTE